MSRTVLAVTGATGAVGGLVARELAERGIAQRLVVRPASAARAPRLRGAEVRTADLGDPVAALAALRGVDVLLMVSGSEHPDRLTHHRTFVDAAARAGVAHVVYTSFLGAAPDATFTLARDHWATEEHLRASGMAVTALRDSLYLDFLPSLAGPDGVIRGPSGRGRVAAVARADVARVAAAVLTDPAPHAGAVLDLTGPQALTLDEVARTITEVTGVATSFQDETVEEAYASRAGFGAPGWQVDAWVSTYTAIAAGELAALSDCVRAITGTPPVSLAEHLRTTGSAASG